MHYLNNRYNKNFTKRIYFSLKTIEDKIYTYDAGLDKDILFNKSQLLLDSWRLFFKKLYPLLYPKYKKKTLLIINIIFANELSIVEYNLFKNVTLAKLSIFLLNESLKKYNFNDTLEFYG